MANYVKMNNESLNLSDRAIFLNYWTHPSDLLTFYTLSYKISAKAMKRKSNCFIHRREMTDGASHVKRSSEKAPLSKTGNKVSVFGSAVIALSDSV